MEGSTLAEGLFPIRRIVQEKNEAQAMHGQKKRRKRSLGGSIAVNETRLSWQLISEPQWTTEDGYKGVCISVRGDESHRELILEYPMPKKRTGNGAPQIPQRPQVSSKTIREGIIGAMAAGWGPQSRGRAFVFKVPENSK